MGERALIERIQRLAEEAARGPEQAGPAKSGSAGVALGIGDDCAILRPPAAHEVLVTTDLLLEGRHFRRDWHSAESAGHRCMARGLSDLAAMGAEPLAAFLSLALPRASHRTDATDPWLDGFLAGLLRLAAEHGVRLAGGDTAEAPGLHVLADIVLVGTAPRGTALRRSGARPGDGLYVSGALGGAAAELEQLAREPFPPRRPGLSPQTFPEPRLQVGRLLREQGIASAAIDLSDGLSTDLAHLCSASGVGAEIDAASIPIHPLAAGRLELALNGGEDYELLFTAPGPVAREIAGIPITRIGGILREGELWLLDGGRREALVNRGFEHFAR